MISSKVRAVSEQLIEKGCFSYPFLGIRYQWFTERIARTYDLPVDQGLYIASVGSNTPAEEAGLRQSDIITHIGDQFLDEEHPFVNVLYTYSPGDTTILSIIRDGSSLEIPVTFSEHPNPNQ